MDLKGSINIMRDSNYFVNDLINLDFPKVANNSERDLLPDPERGDLVITSDDYSLNIYDDVFGNWKKLKANHSMDRAVSLSNSYTPYWRTICCFTISTLGSAEECGELTTAKYDSAVFSNGSGDIGFQYGGNEQHDVNIAGWGNGGGGAKNVIEYFQISTVKFASLFGEADYIDYRQAGTSNYERSIGIVFGGTGDVDRIETFSLVSKGNASYWCNMNRGYGQVPMALSNATNDRAVAGGGSSHTSYFTYSTISTDANSSTFGNVDSGACNRPGGVSNGELDRGVIIKGATTRMEYISISTPANADFFANLLLYRYDTQPASNRMRNRALVISGGQYTYTLSNEYFDISTLADAAYFGDLPTEEYLGGTRATSNS